jgi:hypothetical protein
MKISSRLTVVILSARICVDEVRYLFVIIIASLFVSEELDLQAIIKRERLNFEIPPTILPRQRHHRRRLRGVGLSQD